VFHEYACCTLCLSFTCTAGRCRPPPLVDNAVATLNQTERNMTLTCLPGHRFPDGSRSRVYQCNADGDWQHIPRCDGLFDWVIDCKNQQVVRNVAQHLRTQCPRPKHEVQLARQSSSQQHSSSLLTASLVTEYTFYRATSVLAGNLLWPIVCLLVRRSICPPHAGVLWTRSNISHKQCRMVAKGI